MIYRSNASLDKICFYDKICESEDTEILCGKYFGKECVIKKIEINEVVGIRSKILREVSFLKKVKHKNIIKLYDVCYDNNHIYIILEKGETSLFQLVNGNIKCDDSIDDITLALSYIENIGYIHGDLNLKNVVLFRNTIDGTVVYKLIDFGLTTKVYRTGAIKKPAIFAEPLEMKLGQKIHPDKIDSWGLGAIKCITKYNELSEDFINDVKYLLNDNPNERLTVGQYCLKQRYYDKIYKKENLVDAINMFKYTKRKIQDKYRKSFVVKLLGFNILNKITVENIFMTVMLLEQKNYDDYDDYLKTGMILYYLTTKIVTTIEISSLDIFNLTNEMLINSEKHFSSVKDFNKIVINVLSSYNWDIDVDTQLTYLQYVPDKLREMYTTLCLIVLLSDDLYTISFEYIHTSIMSILFKGSFEGSLDNPSINKYVEKKLVNKLELLFSEIKNGTHEFSTIISSCCIIL